MKRSSIPIKMRNVTSVTGLDTLQEPVRMRQSRNPSKLVEGEKGLAVVVHSLDVVVAVGKAVAADMVLCIMRRTKGQRR